MFLQAKDSTSFPIQAVPPFEGRGLVQERILVIFPIPHVTEQSDILPQSDQPPFTVEKYVQLFMCII